MRTLIPAIVFVLTIPLIGEELDLLAPRSIKPLMTRACDWQLANLKDTVINRSREGDKPEIVRDDGWIRGAFYTGVLAQYDVSRDVKYLDAVRAWGERNEWRLGPRERHADDQTVAQVYADLYFIEPDEKLMRAARKNFDTMIAEPRRGPDFGWSKANNWSWCDALFMAPPAMARMAKATGRMEYLTLLNTLWWDTHGYLYDGKEKLFYRDANFMASPERAQPLSPTGKKIFWGRGNAWVLAGLARTLEFMPADFVDRHRYVELLTEMSGVIAGYQGADGLWRSSLNEPGWHPAPESSSSAMFCYAIACGVNAAHLPEEKFRPVAERAWKGLVSCVDDSGRLGWVQPTGHDPRPVYQHETLEYGTGAFLLAGREMIRLWKERED